MVGLQIHVTSAELLWDKKHLRQTMRIAGAEVAATARSLIKGSAGGGRIYRGPGGSAKYRGGYQKGHYQASAAGGAPASITGTLAKSIRVRPFKSGEAMPAAAAAFSALCVGAGARGGGGIRRGGIGGGGRRGVGKSRVLAARPFLSAALAQRQGSLGPRIQASLAQDIKLVRTKA